MAKTRWFWILTTGVVREVDINKVQKLMDTNRRSPNYSYQIVSVHNGELAISNRGRFGWIRRKPLELILRLTRSKVSP